MGGGFKVFVSGLALVAVTFAGASTGTAQAPAPAPAPQQPAAAPTEPAKPRFTLGGEAAIVTMIIKADKTADFEYVLGRLKEALAKSEKPERKQQAAGWHVFKGSQKTPEGHAVYIMRIDPVIKDAEYDISMIISEVFPVEVQEIFAKYKESFAGRGVSEMTKVMSMQQ
jgi:hypothetical protein